MPRAVKPSRTVKRKGREALRRLYVEQTLGWAAAWLIGIVSLLTVAVTTHGRLSRRDLDAEIHLTGIAIYGLTWIDNAGVFHDEDLLVEPEVLARPYDVWVIGPGRHGRPGTVHLAPEKPRFRIESLERIAAGIVKSEEELFEDGVDAHGAAYRLYGVATYDDYDVPRAAILVAADPTPWKAAHARFVRETSLFAVALVAAGLFVGATLSRRALRPVLESIEQQKHFLAAAAHELRTPVASLRAVCESARTGEETSDDALERVSRLVVRTGGLVEELLLLARLDSAASVDHHQQIRLDLLVEAVLPEDGSIPLDATESIVEADPALLEAAVRNLVDNACVHGGGAEKVRVRVRGGEVVVEDDGPGFSDDLLERAVEPFVSRPGSPGTGLGLAIVRLIAERHGGRLILDHHQSGGARVTLRLGSYSARNASTGSRHDARRAGK